MPELEVWSGPLHDGSKFVLLLNRANDGTEPITVFWDDIGLSANQSAIVRDLWMIKDIEIFIGNYTSTNIDHHSVMILKITPNQ
jgi:hypothetical protein